MAPSPSASAADQDSPSAADGKILTSTAAAESSSRGDQDDDDERWLAALSEPELDFLICLKKLAATRAKTAGHPHLADQFDLRTLRALGVVLLGGLKERLKETSLDPNILDRLALSRDTDADFSVGGSGLEVFRPSKDQPSQNGGKKKRNQNECHEGDVQSNKKRKMSKKVAASIDCHGLLTSSDLVQTPKAAKEEDH
ncbi:uncharacterized protein LOC100841286 isoform X2 [Brachypodium distachyon]|uniref:Gamma-tubulin complex component n=1 Tax=Brachypodium distachyon TaxID=15368 RepID=I1GV23_BRADI|nr:uncharacterized protein LOC100841286 isoform X2 [Brachypodium distachyon]KQK16587.1 hypothetical protein BRADI_1g29420v3 [Brachypodium distachyon]|eukprot:XP_003560293.1 uncharacterized protein LOC100841286 isoform X2 [Brachypodium distachyon]